MTPIRICILGLLAAATAFGAWLTPGNLWKPINSPAAEKDPQPGTGGTVLYLASARSGGYGGYDIYAGYYSNGHWLQVFNLGPAVNSPYNELSPAISYDTYPELYFASDRPNLNGGYDLYRSYFQGGAWQTNVDLAGLNTAGNDTDPYIITTSGSGQRMYYCSDRAGGSGGTDLYYSDCYEGVWTTPFSLGSGVNSSANERGPTLADSGTALYFSSDRPGGLGSYDIYFATRVGTGWGNVANLGAPINTSSAEEAPGVSPNGAQLYFASTRSGGLGNYDIWGSNFTTTLTPTSLGRVKASFR